MFTFAVLTAMKRSMKGDFMGILEHWNGFSLFQLTGSSFSFHLFDDGETGTHAPCVLINYLMSLFGCMSTNLWTLIWCHCLVAHLHQPLYTSLCDVTVWMHEHQPLGTHWPVALLFWREDETSGPLYLYINVRTPFIIIIIVVLELSDVRQAQSTHRA